MRAVLLREFGQPRVLVAEEVPDPVARPGQALIRVVAASVVFVGTKVRGGKGRSPALRPTLPVIPGNGVGGVVIGVGSGVDHALIGSRVVATTGGTGGYAELAAVDAAELLRVPEGLEFADGVALLADGRTAVGLVRATAPQAGEWVLVEAAGGGVGSLLVQLVRNSGARVIAAASSQDKLRLAQRLGADVTVD